MSSPATDALAIDLASTTDEIQSAIRRQTRGELRRKGVVVGLSGGIDSSVVAALSVGALGPSNVFGVLMPERDSADESLELGQLLADRLGIATCVETLGASLDAIGCYRRQREAIRAVVPAYDDGWRCKLVLPSVTDSDRLNVYSLTVEDPDGVRSTTRLPLAAYLQLVAATNFKQRLRAAMLYFHADRLHYAAAGTPNRLEYDQGFFVKNGDGAADLKPIAHLYKTQVYALAEHLGLPDEIRSRPPTTDTFSLPQTQEEFFFALPYGEMDLCLWAANHGLTAEATGPLVGLSTAQVERVFRDIAAKRRTTQYLHRPPLLVHDVPEV